MWKVFIIGAASVMLMACGEKPQGGPDDEVVGGQGVIAGTSPAVQGGYASSGPDGGTAARVGAPRRAAATNEPCRAGSAADIGAGTVDKTDWLTYVVDEVGFSLRHPRGWVVDRDADNANGVIHYRFGPPQADCCWGVGFLPWATQDSMESSPISIGSHLLDREVTHEEVMIDGASAELVTVTTCIIDGWLYDAARVPRPGGGCFIPNNGGSRSSPYIDYYDTIRLHPGRED